MKKKPKTPFQSAVDAHLHEDIDVTLARLDAFANEEVEVQLGVLAHLRIRVNSQEGGQLLGLQSMGIAVFAVIVAFLPGLVPHPVQTTSSASLWWVQPVVEAVVFLILGVLVVIVLSPVGFDLARSEKKRGRAVAWLLAYEDELAQRRIRPGASGRAWRRRHPL